MEYAKMMIRKLLFQGLLHMVLFVEARNLLLDEQVERSIQSALKEFRIAHPPAFLCEAEHCHMAFLVESDLTRHINDPETKRFHAEKVKQFNANQERFLVLEPLFKGAMGRKLKSKRILFNDHLGNLEHRVNAALLAPYRPRLQDPSAKREVQLREDMMVTGYDAKAGVRPVPRKYNMINQHRAPGKRKDQKSFADMLFELLYIGDDNIDIVVAPEAAAHADVKFMYSGYASSTVQIMGEFNAWKPENLFKVDKSCGRCYIIKQLAAGRYRYRYKLETGEIVDPAASKITDIVVDKNGVEREVVSNIIQVANPKAPVPLVAQGVARALQGAVQNKNKRSCTSGSSNGAQVMNSDGVGNEVVVLDRSHRGGADVGKKAVRAWEEDSEDENDNDEDSFEELKQQDIACETLDLRNLALYDDGAWILSSFLSRSNSRVITCDISNNNISDEGMQGFCSILKQMKVMKTLKLNGNGFAYDGTRFLFKGVSECPSLQHLELASNRIANDGCEVIAKFLVYNMTLKSINLSSNHIGDDGIAELMSSLKKNRCLEGITLSANRIGVKGIRLIADAMKVNGIMKYLSVSENKGIGADGAYFLGDMLAQNTSLEYLDISNVELIKNFSTVGIHAVNEGIRKNRTLRVLKMALNGIAETHVVDLAGSLAQNRGIVELDLGMSAIPPIWFQSNTYLTTKIDSKMPTIQTSIDRNKTIHADPELHAKYGQRHPVEMDDGDEGNWTLRRKWREVNTRFQERRNAEAEKGLEYDRMVQEKDYVEEKMFQHNLTVEDFLASEQGQRFTKMVTKVIEECLYEMGKKTTGSVEETVKPQLASAKVLVEPSNGLSLKSGMSVKEALQMQFQGRQDLPPAPGMPETTTMSTKAPVAPSGKAQATGLSGKPGSDATSPSIGIASATADSAVDNTAGKLKASGTGIRPVRRRREVGKVKEIVPMTDPALLVVAPPPPPPPAPMNVRKVITDIGLIAQQSLYGIVASVFRSQGCDAFLRLSPEKIQNVFHFCALPILTLEDAQAAVDASLIPNSEVLGFKRICKYMSTHAHILCKKNKWERMRILADIYFNPPVVEARDIIYHYFWEEAQAKHTADFRAMPGKAPAFVCDICLTRFSAEKLLEKHKNTGLGRSEHVKYHTGLKIWESEDIILKRARFLESGVFFPCFMELNDESKLPKHYFPQVFDKMGEEGHAIGVIEPNVTVRVEDTLGDFMQVRFEGGLGWVRYKGMIQTVESKKPQYVTVLVPSQQHIPDFYKNLEMYKNPVYYRFNDDLPQNTELKVRLKPDLKSDVVGHILENMIVQVWAILDDMWLQIKFRHHESAWVMYKNRAEDIMLVFLHESVQLRLSAPPCQHLIKASPFILLKGSPELVVEKKKKSHHIDPDAEYNPDEIDVHHVE